MLNSNLTSTGQSTQLMTRRANLNTLKQLFKRQPATQNTSTQSIWLLPTELIISIIRYLDLCDTSALLQTCHKMQAITEDYLYANLAIPTVQGVPRTSELMRTLHARPDLSRRVASLEGYLYPLFAKEMAGISTQIPNSYFTFPSNLRSLYLYDHDWWYNPAFVQARYSLSHLALTSLTIRGSGLRGVRGPHHEPNIVPILRLQPILERLDLRLGKWDMESIGPCDIPDLATLSAGTDEARFIVPGRPITSLTLSVKRLEEEEVWKDISASTRRLTSLTLDVLRCGMLLPQTLEMAAAHMTGVESLTLQCLKAHYLEPVYGLIALFPNLRMLRVELERALEDATAVGSMRKSLIEECKRACPSLTMVSVENCEGLLGALCPIPKPLKASRGGSNKRKKRNLSAIPAEHDPSQSYWDQISTSTTT